MCKAFSCIVNQSGKVYWKTGTDEHNKIRDIYKIQDNENNTPIEITPSKGYLYPTSIWVLKFDDKCPDWWKKSHEKHSFEALELWKKEVYNQINIEEVRKPINPLLLKEVKKVNKTQIKLLFEWVSVWKSVGASVRDSVWVSVRDSVWVSVWDSVRDSVWESVGESVWDSVGQSVGASVRDSVWVSVRDSVGQSVWDSIRNSVWDSVRDSVWESVRGSVRGSVWDSVGESVGAYISSLFPKTKFKYDLSSCVKLWKMGLVPSFDGKVWRLHTGKKAKIVFAISKEDLKKYKLMEK